MQRLGELVDDGTSRQIYLSILRSLADWPRLSEDRDWQAAIEAPTGFALFLAGDWRATPNDVITTRGREEFRIRCNISVLWNV